MGPIPPGWGELQVIVPRALCRFGRFDLSRLPAAKRRSALVLQVQGWVPFADPECAVIWQDDGAAVVWCWDRAALQKAWSELDASARLPRAVPEPVLREAPTVDGLRLFEGLQGFEAQRWVDGALVGSRWWPTMPTEAEQRQFIRECGMPAATPFELMAHPPVLGVRPWASLGRLTDGDAAVGVQERAAYWAIAFSLGAPAVYLGVDQARLIAARMSAEAELAQASEQSRGLIEAREAALTKAEHVRALQQLSPYPSPLVVMMALSRALPEGGGSTIREWELNEGKLRVMVVSPAAELAGAEHVRALEGAGLFSEVKLLTQSDPRQMAFSVQLRTHQALATPSSASAPGAAP